MIMNSVAIMDIMTDLAMEASETTYMSMSMTHLEVTIMGMAIMDRTVVITIDGINIVRNTRVRSLLDRTDSVVLLTYYTHIKYF